MRKFVLALAFAAVVAVLLLSFGCTSQKYVCSDGSVVDSLNKCPARPFTNRTAKPPATPPKFVCPDGRGVDDLSLCATATNETANATNETAPVCSLAYRLKVSIWLDDIFKNTTAVLDATVAYTGGDIKKDALITAVGSLNSTLERIGKEARATDAGKCTLIRDKMLDLASKSIAIANATTDVDIVGAIARDIGPISRTTTEVLSDVASAE